ncbi:quinol:cytochrome C oxidoreductase [Croceiramulus getboli]|nr:quinol:cytochrome C oxidoreductase [Flavobacteriaceae bacterium YJPT1-3]
MYTLSNKLRMFSIIFMAVGALLFIVGYIVNPSTIEEVKHEMAAHGGDHGEEHATATHQEASELDGAGVRGGADTHGNAGGITEEPTTHATADHDADHAEAGHDDPDAHAAHALDQYHNKPWAAIYIAAFFFFMIALGALAFYAIQYAAQAGWSPLLLRVMEGITGYLLPGSLIVLLLLVLSGLHLNHLFHWMDPELTDPSSDHYDALIDGKSGYLNVPFFLIRAIIFIAGWNIYRHFARKFSLKQDEATDNRWHRKSFKAAAAFLVFFIVTESIMSWDWIMSVDPHWFSTLFGWYVFAGMMVCAITVIAMVTMYLKSLGLLPQVNDSHIHDLAKFMFGFSIFWTYLWFSQFMLIWYSNIPEEVTYFVTRIEDFKLPFFGMVVMNFVFPLLILMNSDYKRINLIVIMAGVIILAGHYLDVFMMISPATVGASWGIGLLEIGAIFFFFGLFVLVVFSTLAKESLVPKRNPLLEESKHFHY